MQEGLAWSLIGPGANDQAQQHHGGVPPRDGAWETINGDEGHRLAPLLTTEGSGGSMDADSIGSIIGAEFTDRYSLTPEVKRTWQINLNRLHWAASMVGINLPGSSWSHFFVATAVVVAQVLSIAYTIYRTIKNHSGVITVVNSVLTILQAIIPMIFIRWYAFSTRISMHGRLSDELNSWLAAGGPGWRKWFIPVVNVSTTFLILSTIIQWRYIGSSEALMVLLANLVMWAPPVSGLLLCCLITAPHIAAYTVVVKKCIRGTRLEGGGGESSAVGDFLNDTRPFLRKIKKDLTTINSQMEFDSKVPNVLFILPMCLITALFMLNSMWALYLEYYNDGGIEDDEYSRSFVLAFYISGVFEEVSLLIALALPLAVTNTTADRVAFEIIDTFYCIGESATWVSTASQWVLGSRLGWKVLSFRPTLRVLETAVASAISIALIMMTRFVQ